MTERCMTIIRGIVRAIDKVFDLPREPWEWGLAILLWLAWYYSLNI